MNKSAWGQTLRNTNLIKISKIPDYASIFLRHGAIGNHPMLANVPISLRTKVLDRIAIGRRHKFCYFRVPKVANSTIVQSLWDSIHQSEDKTVDSETAKLILQGIPSIEELERMFVFTFVRHPVTRTLSAYLDKCLDQGFRRKHKCLQGSIGTPAGFANFLDQLADGQLLDNIHWAPQTSILPWKLDRYDFIGRFENLNEDLGFCLNHIFPGKSIITLHNPHRTGADEKLRGFVGKRQQQLIEQLYSADFERFYPNAPAQNPSGMSL
jgi:dermatan 4-sulfotransferase 1